MEGEGAEVMENVPVQELYTKAANAKRSLNRSKKDLQMGLKALQEVPGSSYFFDQLVHYQGVYRERRTKVYDLYDKIEDQIPSETFKKDFGKPIKDLEKDYDVLEEEARLLISRYHHEVDEMTARARAAGGGEGEAAAPRWKLQSSFQPKPPLKLDMGGEELANWERQFQIYFDISNLRHADIGTQRAVLQNCLNTDLQVKLHEAISGIPDIETGLTLIREEFQRRHPRVVRQHNLFSIEQKKDEYCFSDTVTRLGALARDADLTDMTKDSILCHLMLRACKDDNLRAKMLEVAEADMTQVRLNEVIELYETIQRTNKGLGEKEKAKRAKASDSSVCFRCQGRSHFAADCTVPEKSLFCQTCSEHGIPLPHGHNTFAGCKGKKKEEPKNEDLKRETKKTETSKTNRAKVRDFSPAGEPESSDSDDESVQARRVKMTTGIEDKVPAGSASSADEDDEMFDLDSGWASRTEEEEDERENDNSEEDFPFPNNADFYHVKVRGFKAEERNGLQLEGGRRTEVVVFAILVMVFAGVCIKKAGLEEEMDYRLILSGFMIVVLLAMLSAVVNRERGSLQNKDKGIEDKEEHGCT